MSETNINWNTKIDIECPGCKTTFGVKVKELKPGNKIKCPGCKNDIDFTGNNVVKMIKEQLDIAERTLKKKFKF